MKQRSLFLIVFLLPLLVQAIHGQINIKVGYTLDYSDYAKTNAILNEFNRINPNSNIPFKAFHINHGLQLGARFKKDFIAIDLGVERVSATREANTGNQSYQIKNQNNRIFAGLELHSKYTGLGLNFYLEQIRYSDEFSSRTNILTDSDYGNKVYFIYKVPGSQYLSLNLQPYVMIPWTSSNVFGLHDYLGNEALLTSYNQRNLHYGISLVFYNGKK